MKSWFTILLALYSLVVVSALHLDIPAESNPKPVCIRDFVPHNEMVVVTIKTSGKIDDGQRLSFAITDTLNNQFRQKKNIYGDVKVSFTTHAASAIDICFTNTKTQKWSRSQNLHREVELEIESGAAARNWNALQTAEKLKPNELELRKVESLTEEIATELHYLKGREERMRDTNESTNSRVKWFSIVIIVSLIALGVWQIQYLRNYFRLKHII